MERFLFNEIEAFASKLTSNSELFSDEVQGVVSQLVELSNSANKYGCDMPGTIRTYWGNSVPVVAVPTVRKHSWSF